MAPSLRIHPTSTPTERAAQLAADERSYARRARNRLLARVLGCLGSCAAGSYLLGLSMHMTDAGLAVVVFWSALLVGNGGILVTLVAAYLDAEEAGDL